MWLDCQAPCAGAWPGGVFSHEAGLGSAPIAAAAAKTDDPVGQSYIAMTGTFFDTILVCSATGLAIASSGLLGAAGRDGQPLTGVALTNTIFETALGPVGRLIITLGIAMFAFATIIGWEYYGEKALEYIVESGWRRKGDTMSVLRRRRWISFYRLIYCALCFCGGCGIPGSGMEFFGHYERRHGPSQPCVHPFIKRRGGGYDRAL